ncbi:hypothetical protein BBJ28_00000595 [Nothophytophthora sp. Chile5]|nr:hypothetical protein BBJ28_00000595 [Nothophytophthora sp. Chile5]
MLLDVFVQRDDRWHSSASSREHVQTQDRLGDHLVAMLHKAARAPGGNRMTGFALELWWKLRWYEKETRLLVKLASTEHIVRVLERFARKVEGCKQVFGMEEGENWASWKGELERERKERVEFFQALIDDDARLDAEMGDEQQQMEALTLLKYDMKKGRRNMLTPLECDLISSAYDRVVRRSGLVVVSLPKWFVPSREFADGAEQGSVYFDHSPVVSDGKDTSFFFAEELCLRQAAIWVDLHHPHKVLGRAASNPYPDIVDEKEWNLLVGMWSPHSEQRLAMADVVLQLEVLAMNEMPAREPELEKVADVCSYKYASADRTLAEMLMDLKEWCPSETNESEMDRQVYDRLKQILEHLQKKTEPVSVTVLDDFGRIVLRLLEVLERRDDGSKLNSYWAGTLAGTGNQFHSAIDRLISSCPFLHDKVPVRLWQQKWENAFRLFQQDMPSFMENVHSEEDRAEAAIYLQFEANKRRAVDKLIDFGAGLWQELQVYEDSRPLLKLASTGRANHLLERWRSRLMSLVKSVGALEEVTLELWTTVLHDERQYRMDIAQRTLLIPSQLEYEMGDEAQQEEALMLLKHCCENYRSVLMPMELEVIAEVYDQMTRLSGLMIGAIPKWFIPSTEMSHKDWHERAVAFSLDCLLRDSRLGTALLSGLGLVEQLHEDRPGPGYMERSALVASNVCAFGLAIFALRENNTIHSVLPHECTDLPNDKPDFLKDDEWNLLLGMCAVDPGKRASMDYITHTMKILAQDEENGGPSSNEMLDLPTEFVEDVKTYICVLTGGTIEELLDGVDEMCEEFEELASVYRPVYHRLVDIYKQLEAVPGSLSAVLVEEFSAIVYNFVNKLNRHFVSDSSVFSGCDSRTIADRNFGLHRDIDRLIRSTPILEQTASIHSWQPVAASLGAEALALPQFEAQRHSSLLMEFEGAEGNRLDVLLGDVLPLWFIPPYQVELIVHVADGSFASVYVGEWLGADVIVKQLPWAEMGMEFRNQFLQELGLWFALNHPNLIRMYGACHEGRRPFFVCERAHLGTLASFAKGKRRSLIWRFLCQAAEGLAHLHELGIIHADLKGNNILVCENYGKPIAKLADFGMSFYAGTASTDYEGALGAFRWKAPECLMGGPPSFESDMYSFGMCILEALSGEYPWGNSIPDEAVRFCVTHEKQLPPRPETLGEDEWGLIKHMCCFEPSNRITDPELVEALNDINFRSSWKNLSQ